MPTATTEPTLISTVVAWLLVAVPNLIAALAFIIVGYWLARACERALMRLMNRHLQVDPTLRAVLGSTLRYAVLLLFVIAAIAQLGFQMSSILAVLATAGLAIGLALQATLSNIAAGIMLLWLRPFRIGDQIEVGPITGKIVEVGLFACEMQTNDGVYEFVPNSELWNKRLINYSRLPLRLATVRVRVTDIAAIERVRKWAAAELPNDRRVVAEPKPGVVVSDLSDDKIVLSIQAWTTTQDYAGLVRDISDQVATVALTPRHLD